VVVWCGGVMWCGAMAGVMPSQQADDHTDERSTI
jgi:hypothetical protein